MTGIVVVSHSRALADAAVVLASEMLAEGDVRIEVAAGLDEETLGTDAVAIGDAITAADDGAGVVVLMDLGSAVLSAELARDLIDPAVADRVVLCPAPIVEGLVVAAVAAAGGGAPYDVADEAMSALLAKTTQLAAPAAPTPDVGVAAVSGSAGDAGPVTSGRFTVRNPHGLHARPAARLVQVASQYEATVSLTNLSTGLGPVSARSLSRVATLGALLGHDLELTATGTDSRAAIDALVELAERAFDEDLDPATTPAAVATQRSTGPLPVSPGVAIGPARPLTAVELEIPDAPSDGAAVEWARLEQALTAAADDIGHAQSALAGRTGDEARVFDAHLLLLSDDELLVVVRQHLDDGDPAARAWSQATTELADRFEALPDAYLRDRATDVRAVERAVLAHLLGVDAEQVHDLDGIVVAEDLTPAQVAQLDVTRVQGIVLTGGSPTGHSAILAKARGIPTVVGAGPPLATVPVGTTVAIDGSTGAVVVDPDPATLADFRAKAVAHERSREEARRLAAGAARTADGFEVQVMANVGSVGDAEAALAEGADGVGLVRTEFLFLDREVAPGITEQVETYGAIAAALAGRRVTFRTLDVGGDKPLPYVRQAAEDNPFLGVRGLRLALAERRLLADQLDALVHVAFEAPVSVMFPMVSLVSELTEALQRLDVAIAKGGRGRPPGLEVGIMVEVPAVAMKAAAFAPYVDFFSIGTNDLTQYAMAAERGNPALAPLADPLDPGVLGLVEAVCAAAAGGPLVAVCGEVAADPVAARLLVAMGVRELSMAPQMVPTAKQAVRAIELATDDDLVKRSVRASSADEVRDLLR